MVEFSNLKNYQVGERVRCNNHGDIHTIYEGVITYIHPTNGWLTILVDKVRETTKGISRKTRTYKLRTPYRASFYFYCVYRANEKIKKEPTIRTGGEVIELSSGKKPRKTYARRASSVPKEDDFGFDEIWDEAV